jgi:hypothetical protein
MMADWQSDNIKTKPFYNYFDNNFNFGQASASNQFMKNIVLVREN